MTGQAIALPPAIGWMPILHQIVDSGTLARMHASAPALYIAIKRYVDYRTGYAEVSNKQLCKAIGITKPTFSKARKSLLENGLIEMIGNHIPARYVVREHLHYYSADRTPIACAVFPYIPAIQGKNLEALKNQPLTLDQIGKTVTIGSINVQIFNVIGSDPCGKEVGSFTGQAADLTREGKNPTCPGSEIAPYKDNGS